MRAQIAALNSCADVFIQFCKGLIRMKDSIDFRIKSHKHTHTHRTHRNLRILIGLMFQCEEKGKPNTHI